MPGIKRKTIKELHQELDSRLTEEMEPASKFGATANVISTHTARMLIAEYFIKGYEAAEKEGE